MNRPPVRDQQTRMMIRRLEEKRRRRRRLRMLLSVLAAAVVVALVATAVVLATQDDTPWALDETTESLSADASVPPVDTSETPPPTTDAPATTVAAPAPTTTTQPATTSTTAAPTTSVQQTTTSSSKPATSGGGTLVVVIDPGHQGRADSNLEPIGPGSSQQKARVSSGTAGVATGTPESELVLAVSLKLRDSLAAHGIKVVMTRTTQDINISNIERAKLANEAGADLFVRVHADGNSDPAVHGIHVLYPASVPGWTDDIAATSKKAAALAQQELIAATGAKDRGIDARDDMTGFNWADVPVILPEIGFMTNPDEDKLLATSAYQDKIVGALTRAILAYLGVS